METVDGHKTCISCGSSFFFQTFPFGFTEKIETLKHYKPIAVNSDLSDSLNYLVYLNLYKHCYFLIVNH